MALKYPISFRRTSSELVPNIPIIEGQVIFEVEQDENGRIFMDADGVRRTIGGNFLPSYDVTFPASGWSANAPYTQTVTVNGVRPSDTMIPTLNQGSATSEENQRNMQLNFNYILWYDSGLNQITATAPFTKPIMDMNVKFIGQ